MGKVECSLQDAIAKAQDMERGHVGEKLIGREKYSSYQQWQRGRYAALLDWEGAELDHRRLLLICHAITLLASDSPEDLPCLFYLGNQLYMCKTSENDSSV